MKRLRLNKKGKILVTAITVIMSIIIYSLMTKYGALASENTKYLTLILSGWSWLLIGQFVVYHNIWEN